MKTLDLTGLSGDALHAKINEAVAVTCAGFQKWEGDDDGWGRLQHSGGWWDHTPFPPYATSCDAVMPLLEKCGPYIDAEIVGKEWHIRISDYDSNYERGVAATFPLAACIALLRAHSWEVVG